MNPPPVIALESLELDALTELVNLGIGRAATSLGSMIGSEVLLAVPAVEIMSYERAAELMRTRSASDVVAVYQSFAGDISGGALLIFPETNSFELVSAITGGNLPLDEIIALEQEALAETGNIILNGCLATIANMLSKTLQISLPEIMRGSGEDIFRRSASSVIDATVLFLYIDFSVRSRDIQGNIAMLMDLPSLLTLKTLLGTLIDRASGESGAGHASP